MEVFKIKNNYKLVSNYDLTTAIIFFKYLIFVNK